MGTLLFIVFGLWTVVFGYAYPFVTVLRGRRFFRAIVISWVALVALLLCGFIVPIREYRSEWSRDKAFTIAFACTVWVLPLASALLALFVRWLLRLWWPRALVWVESFKCRDNATQP